MELVSVKLQEVERAPPVRPITVRKRKEVSATRNDDGSIDLQLRKIQAQLSVEAARKLRTLLTKLLDG